MLLTVSLPRTVSMSVNIQ